MRNINIHLTNTEHEVLTKIIMASTQSTVETITKPSFGDWWCELQGITPESSEESKLRAYLVLRAMDKDIPNFLKPYQNGQR